MNEWNKFVFSDECFVKPTKTGIDFCRKFDNEDWLDERFNKKGEIGIYIWAAISCEGVLTVEWLNPVKGETSDSDCCIKMLYKYIFQDEKFNKDNEDGLTFFQDYATIQTSKNTIKTMDDSNIYWASLSPKSPDRNPIDYVRPYAKNACFECKGDF